MPSSFRRTRWTSFGDGDAKAGAHRCGRGRSGAYAADIFDFETWREARSWSYCTGYLLADEMARTHDVDVIVLNHRGSIERNHGTIEGIRASGRSYDLAILLLPHALLTKCDVAAVMSISKATYIFYAESLVYTKQDYRELPHLRKRLREAKDLYVPGVTYLMLCRRSYTVLQSGGYPARHTFGFLPTCTIGKAGETSRSVFHAGTLYNERRRSLMQQFEAAIEREGLIVRRPNDPASDTHKFELLMWLNIVTAPGDFERRLVLSRQIMDVRRDLWLEYLRQLSQTRVVVSLPGYFSGVPSRVIEGRLCGKPILMPDSNLDDWSIAQLRTDLGIMFIDATNIEAALASVLRPDPRALPMPQPLPALFPAVPAFFLGAAKP